MRILKELTILLFVSGITFGQQVAVDAAGRGGSAVLRNLGTDCYAITANHVVDRVAQIEITDGSNHHASAFLKEGYKAADLAVLEVTNDRTMCNQANWPDENTDVANLLQGAGAEGKLVKVTGGSSVAQIPVTIASFDGQQVVVNPPPNMTIAIGWSGSGLYVRNILAGILLDVDTSTGRGIVSRIDYVDRIISDIFHPGVRTSDRFMRDVSSPEFDQRTRQIFSTFVANRLEDFKTSQYTVTTDNKTIMSYFSSLQLPGFSRPGTLDFRNKGKYNGRERLDKHPINLIYTEKIDDDSYLNRDLKKARFDALSVAISNIVPSSWTRNSYSRFGDYSEEFEGSGLRIKILTGEKEFTLEFFPKDGGVP